MEAQNPQPEIVELISTADVFNDVGSRAQISETEEAPLVGVSNARDDAHERSTSMRKLWISLALSLVFTTVEVVVGMLIAHSLAILTDAAHMLTDVASYAVNLFALWAAGWEPTRRHPYGFLRIEILGVLVSVLLTWLLVGILVYEAIVRVINIHDQARVNGLTMFLVGLFGLMLNGVMAYFLGHHGHGHPHGHGHGHDDHNHGHDDHNHSEQQNVNVQGAYLHVLTDFIQNIGVMIGGIIIWGKPDWKIADPICTLICSVISCVPTYKMLRNILEVLLQSAPRDIDVAEMENGLLEMDQVLAIRDLRVWSVTFGKVVLTCRVKINTDANSSMVLHDVLDYLKRESNITHVTIQIEY